MVDPQAGYQITDASIKDRADALEKPVETKVETAEPEVKTETPEVKTDPKVETKAPETETKGAPKAEEKHIPNDPAEFQKFVTRSAQENAELRRKAEAHERELKELRDLVQKATKKPIDWAAISKDPAKVQELWEQHEAELEQEKNSAIFVKEVEYTGKEMARDTQNYPDFVNLQPLMAQLAGTDGSEALKHDPNFNWNRSQKEVLHDLYKLAEKISPKVTSAPTGKVMTPEEIEKIKEDAKAEAIKAATTKETKQAAGASATGQFGGKGRKASPTTADDIRNAPTLDEARKLLKRSQGK
jgi:hypothetical protein